MPHAKRDDHENYMRRCFELARRGLGYTRSNPIVGAVLVHGDRIIGEGWHREWGGPHAEVGCLENVSSQDKGLIPESTLYVSLEPCAHWGKQPPCAERIVAEGIRRVVVSVDDPAPHVNGRGYGILETAGIEVIRGVLRDEGRWLARRFLSLQEQSRPYVILKWAQSADCYIAPPQGRRVIISSGISQRLVHKWRTEEDAILVGYRTALLDNPQLTARLWNGRQPLRIVLDRGGSLPHTQLCFSKNDVAWWVTEHEFDNVPVWIRPIQLQFDDSLPEKLLLELHRCGYSSIIIEGGAATIQKFMRAGLWDEARMFYTPVVLGEGLAAPVLQNAERAFLSNVDGTDELAVFTRAGSRYPYPVGTML